MNAKNLYESLNNSKIITALQDPGSLRKELEQYGLGLVEVEEILEMYVIREIDL